jgi:Sulfatase
LYQASNHLRCRGRANSHALFPPVERRQALKILTHPAAVAFGLANLYLLDLTAPLIDPNHDLIYHLIGSASPIVIPIIVYLILLFLLLAALLLLARRPGPLRVIIWSAFLLAIPSILLHTIADFTSADIPDWLTYLVALCALFLLLVIALRWRQFLPIFEKIQGIAATILGVFAFSGLVIFAQLIWCVSQTRNLNPSPVLHHSQATTAHPRIVWLLLDELSYQQLYERRFPGLELPAFDQLAAQSTVFAHASPIGAFTRFVIPSLFTGQPSNEIHVSPRGLLLSLRDTATGKWIPFVPRQTVFQDALDAGYTTGIAGWYNPYCRMMPQVLDHCFWTYRQFTPANLSPNRSLATDLVRPLHYLLLDIKHFFGRGPGAPTDELRNLRQHTADYRSILTAGDADLTDPSIDFLFLHMPIPHPYGIYDRSKKAFATHPTSYIDNLDLCDQYLAHIRHLLEQQNQWDSTTLIVMGDHSWRTSFVWANSAFWTDEDDAASHNAEFDDRPAYIVKLPNQQTAARIDQPFAIIHTRALLDALLKNKIHTAADLQTWAIEQK